MGNLVIEGTEKTEQKRPKGFHEENNQSTILFVVTPLTATFVEVSSTDVNIDNKVKSLLRSVSPINQN